MKRNMTEIEQRLLVILKKDSRRTIVEAAEELGVSRITAKKAFDSLISEGRIKNFTVNISEDMKDLVLVHTKSLKSFPQTLLIESFRLLDGTYLAVLYYENLPRIRDLPIIDVQIATERTINDSAGRLEHLHCDYCDREITGNPIILELRGKTYYACCPNCERDLNKGREFEPQEAAHAHD